MMDTKAVMITVEHGKLVMKEGGKAQLILATYCPEAQQFPTGPGFCSGRTLGQVYEALAKTAYQRIDMRRESYMG